MLADLTVKDFLDKVACSDPVPGGGSIAALNGALASSLSTMVARLTVGKKGYEVSEEVMQHAQTITALTLNGAAALQRADRIGSIEVGKQGDFIILNSDNYHILPYYIGMNCVIMTIKGGILYPVA